MPLQFLKVSLDFSGLPSSDPGFLIIGPPLKYLLSNNKKKTTKLIHKRRSYINKHKKACIRSNWEISSFLKLVKKATNNTVQFLMQNLNSYNYFSSKVFLNIITYTFKCLRYVICFYFDCIFINIKIAFWAWNQIFVFHSFVARFTSIFMCSLVCRTVHYNV